MIIGKTIFRYSEIDSTNEEARRLIGQGEGEGAVIVAKEQSKGRGKPGNTWFSPKGNLYLSVILKPYKNPHELASITLIAAAAGKSMLSKVANLSAVIKPPNDLLVDGKKIGGILTERLPSGHLIIGVGINVNSVEDSFPPDLRTSSTALKIETKKTFELEKCLQAFLLELNREYLAYLSKF